MDTLEQRAVALDAADPLGPLRDRFLIEEGSGVVAYLDGNSLGRPLRVTAERLGAFVDEAWGERLIRGWDDGWLTEPETLGDRLGALVLGAGPGQVVVADSTSVLLYKLARATLVLGDNAARRDLWDRYLATDPEPVAVPALGVGEARIDRDADARRGVRRFSRPLLRRRARQGAHVPR